MVIAGGVGTLFGAFVGAAAIIALENIVSAYTERWQMVLGIIFILIMIFAPEGIIGKLRSHPDAQGALIETLSRKEIEMDRRQFLKTATAAAAAAGVGARPGAALAHRPARSRSACSRRSPASSRPAARRWSRAFSSISDR